MAFKLYIALAALILIVPMVFADVGPQMPHPTITVHLMKDGQPDGSIDQITYHCNKILTPGDDPMEANTAVLECSEGECTNDGGWFYKHNPCYDAFSGYFTFTSEGVDVSSDVIRFSDSFSSYSVEIDSTSGNVGSKSGSNIPGCLGAILLPALLGAAFLRK